MCLRELAVSLGCQLEGDPELELTGIAGLAEAGPHDLSFLSDRRWVGQLATTQAGAVLVSLDCAVPASLRNRLRTEKPELILPHAVALLRPPWQPGPGIHATASIHPTAELGRGCHVGAFVAIGEGCRLGDGCVLHPHVVLYPGVVAGARLLAHAHVVIREGTRLGDDVVLQPGVVLGGDGFGFVRQPDGSSAKIPQVGTVEVGDGVEIQANSCVDRASLETTRIGPGAKLDNLVQVAHNCQVEENAILCAQVGLAGSTRIGAGAILAGQVGVAGHCHVGAGAIVTAQSGTHGDLEPGRMVSGSPAFDHAQWLRATAAFARLPELQRELRQLREEVRKLTADQA